MYYMKHVNKHTQIITKGMYIHNCRQKVTALIHVIEPYM